MHSIGKEEREYVLRNKLAITVYHLACFLLIFKNYVIKDMI